MGLNARLPGYPALGTGEAPTTGDPLATDDPLVPGRLFEPPFVARKATPTMAAIARPPTRNIAGLTPLRAGVTAAVEGGIAHAGCGGAEGCCSEGAKTAPGAGNVTGAGIGTGAGIPPGVGVATGAGAGAGAGDGAGVAARRVAPHEMQNICPAAANAVPQLGQKPNPVAISISV